MNDKLFENGYVILENFFTEQQVDYFSNQSVESVLKKQMVLGNNPLMGEGDSVHPMSWNVNSHPIWQNTLYSVLPQVSEFTDEKLIPTYSFQRVYLKGASMTHHTDWPWCQISLTINLGQSHSYPIYVTSLKTKESIEVIQKPGDAILYLGHNISHYRNEFEGDWYSQLFLHYVIDNEAMEKHMRFDKDIFHFKIKDNMEHIFYPLEVKQLQEAGYKTPDMKKDDKDKIIPLDSSLMFKTSNRTPRLDINDRGSDVSLHGGQYKVKPANWFMDATHQTYDALTPKFCKELIDLYESYAKKNETRHGLTHRGLDNDYKDTGELDLMSLSSDEAGDYIKKLQEVSDHCIVQYVKKFGLTEHYDVEGDIFGDGIYYPMWEIHKYEKGVGHYESWHIEGSHQFEYGNRMFVSMFYLNDVEEGGRTVFPYSKTAVKSEVGKHFAFPCFWPYVHYAQTPVSDDKYIVTSWMNKVWPDAYHKAFESTPHHKKQDDVRKTKFIFEETK